MSHFELKFETFEQFSAHFIPIIDSGLSEILPESWNELANGKLVDAMRYSLLAKAKRIRPLLCICSSLLFGSEYKPILTVAYAVEMLHCYSLIHDDLPAMDNDDFRRGIPTCHCVYGDAIGILAGDALNTFAFEYLASNLPSFYPADRVLRAISALAYSCGVHGMAGGQYIDIQALSYSFLSNDEHEAFIRHLQSLKTGALIEQSIVVPAQLAGMSQAVLSVLSKLGYHIGVLFQMVDDVLDVTSTSEQLGKQVQKDASQSKQTLVHLFGLPRSLELVECEYQSAKTQLDSLRVLGYSTGSLQLLLDYLVVRTR